jgi:hypothetical protein
MWRRAPAPAPAPANSIDDEPAPALARAGEPGIGDTTTVGLHGEVGAPYACTT